ncbi:MAG: TrkH family potassium uptake protein [Deferribacterales bacterium]
MHLKLIIKTVAILQGIIALFHLLCGGMGFYFKEHTAYTAFFTSGILLITACSVMLFWLKDEKPQTLGTKDGFVLVTASWVGAVFAGALPYFISGVVPTFADAVFETISGLSTTGASIITDIEALPKSILFWRSLTHWLGGMGIVVLAVAILPLLGIGGMQLISAEAPGPTVDKITPRITETAKYLWYIYLLFTVTEIVLLRFGGMSLFDAVSHSFATVATGGFSTKNTSIKEFDSAYIDYVITTFMVLSGINFTLHFRFLTGKFKNIFIDSEFKTYITIFLAATLIITLSLTGEVYGTFMTSFRYASFQVASFMTTTGFATDDYEKWPYLAQIMLFLLMFVGGCSGSTGGGIKVIRIITLLKQGLNEMKYLVHPRAVFVLRINGQPVKKNIVYAISGFFFLYITMVLLVTIITVTSGADILTSFTAALTTIGNIGPGFGLIGPTENFAFFPQYVKWTLSAAMLLGRLEIYTVLVLFTPIFWKK